MYKHTKCRYYFPNVFSQIKTQTWCFQIYSLWSWNMRWAFTRTSETLKQPVLFYALVWFSHALGPHSLIGCGKSPFHPRTGCFVSAWVLDLRKNTGWFTGEKGPFLWSTIYPANFDTFNGDLELVPSGISSFLVFFFTLDETISYWILCSLGSTSYKSVNGVCSAESHLTAPATWRKNVTCLSFNRIQKKTQIVLNNF